MTEQLIPPVTMTLVGIGGAGRHLYDLKDYTGKTIRLRLDPSDVSYVYQLVESFNTSTKVQHAREERRLPP